MNKVKLIDIEKKGGKVRYNYEIEGSWRKYFNSEHVFEIEYSQNIEGVPDSVLAVPFVCNIIPIVWLCDATLYMEILDEDYYENLEYVKNGYKTMYPMLEFEGKIQVKNIQKNVPEEQEKSAVFFSGGVDAYTTLFRTIEEQPSLITIWGSDVKLNDLHGWKNVENHIMSVSQEYKLDVYVVKSNFRMILKEEKLDRLVKNSLDGWWHGFQNGIALIGHAAPLSYLFGFAKVYIASSYPEKMKGQYTCASDPTIDNHVRYCGTRTIHDAYELDRQEKIQYIIENKKRGFPIRLRVCWDSRGGSNCCRCEKCYRTILEIISEMENPKDYGFEWNELLIEQCKKDMLTRFIMPDFNINQWYYPIVNRLRMNKDKIDNFDMYKWLLDIDFKEFNNYPIKKFNNSLIGRGLNKVKRIISDKNRSSKKV